LGSVPKSINDPILYSAGYGTGSVMVLRKFKGKSGSKLIAEKYR
jgi:hypothetical protein